jgi:[acyl-carrier-protein] S-malonyltransferase
MAPALLPGSGVAAQVGKRRITDADVEARVRRLRNGRLRDCLPAEGCAEARQFRRWVVQVLATEAVVHEAADSLGVASPGDAEGQHDAQHYGLPGAGMGSIMEAVLATSPLARSLLAVVTAEVGVDQAAVRTYYERNRDDFRQPDRCILVHEIDGRPVNAGRPIVIRRGDVTGVVEAAVFAATPGSTVTVTDESGHAHVARVQQLLPGDLAPFEDVRDAITERLLSAARRRAFSAWVDRRRTALLWLAPGNEHPGDPSQPDNTHRH